MANTNTEIIALLETNPSQAIRGVLDTLYLYNPAPVNELIAQLNDVIAKVGFEAIVVDALPETGKKGTIYFVPSGGETPNVYNEYIWVAETEKFEMVGSAQVDLSNYYTKDEVDNQLDAVLPDQTDNAGKFLTTNGTTPSWSDKPQVNKSENPSSIMLTLPTDQLYGNEKSADCVVVGPKSRAADNGNIIFGKNIVSTFRNNVCIGWDFTCAGTKSIFITADVNYTGYWESKYQTAIGYKARTGADYAIQLGSMGAEVANNVDANTFKVANQNGNFEMMSADGSIPTDRYTTTPTTAGTYVPKLTVAEDGTVSREWGADSGGDYLPLSGGTMTGEIAFNEFNLSDSYTPILRQLSTGELAVSVQVFNGNYVDICKFSVAGNFVLPGSQYTTLGSQYNRWGNVYVTKLNNGADIAVPTEGGTLARLEDLDNIYVATIKEYD